MRTMDFTTEQPDCCSVGDYLILSNMSFPLPIGICLSMPTVQARISRTGNA